MSRIVRRLAAGLVVLILLLSSPTLAAADSFDRIGSREDRDSVPIMADLLVYRPIGIVVTVVGFVGFVATSPFWAITRPTELNKPFRALVVCPARYVWVDPLGSHPDRDCRFGDVYER